MPKLGRTDGGVNRTSRVNDNLIILGSGQPAGTDVDGQLSQMRQNRLLSHSMGRSRKQSAASSANGSNFMHVIPKWYDPTEFYENSNIPWDPQNEEHRKRLMKWMRSYYTYHPLIPILIDIFTRFPLIGIELTSKDNKLTDYYTDLFMDQLDYAEFFTELGREYWTVGEAFPLGSFDETRGVWDREEIVATEDIEVSHFPLLGSTQYSIKAPDYLIELATSRQPAREYAILEKEFADIIPLLKQRKNIPVSDQLMRQVAFKIRRAHTHGTPILLRALRTLIHEEKLMSAQDAIAERLYSPLILAKLGIQDIGDGVPWIPTQDELMSLRDDFDVALESEMRLLVHHFGLEVTNVFGRESMPRLGDDFDRVDAILMRTFGIHPQLLTGGVHNVPYASSALQAEFMNQILRTYQGYLKRHFRERALLVAEAQEHYDYEKKGDKRIPIMEEHLEIDEDGNERIVKKHKLLIPDMTMKVLDLRDEATQRQFLGMLKGAGVPVSDKSFMVGMPTTFEEELESATEEAIQKTIAQQEGKVKLYKILRIKNAPIPPALAAEVGAMVEGVPGAMEGPQGMRPDVGGPGEQFLMPSEGVGPPGGLPPGGGMGPGGPSGMPTTPTTSPIGPGPAGSRPPSSNERSPIRPPSFASRTASANIDLAELDRKLAEIEEKTAKADRPDWIVEEDGAIVHKVRFAPRKVATSLVDTPRLDTES